jgi:hypothetical protein
MRLTLFGRVALIPGLVLVIFIISLVAGVLESQRADRSLTALSGNSAPMAMDLQRGPSLFASCNRQYEDAVLINDEEALVKARALAGDLLTPIPVRIPPNSPSSRRCVPTSKPGTTMRPGSMPPG